MATEEIPESWRAALEPVLADPQARKLGGWLRAEEERGQVIYPPRGQRLAALALTLGFVFLGWGRPILNELFWGVLR